MWYFIQKFFKIFSAIIRGLFSESEYYIKKGYKHRKEYRFYDSTQTIEVYQKEVYEFTKKLMQENDYSLVVDLGCGKGEKLIKYLGAFHTIGIEVSPTYKYLQETYPDKEWVLAKEREYYDCSSDIILCADVIEHVINPDVLIEQIKNIKNWKHLVISTPERNIIRGCNDWGPPKNPHHIREWDGWEFRKYIGQHFEIEQHWVTNYTQGTQMLVCSKK